MSADAVVLHSDASEAESCEPLTRDLDAEYGYIETQDRVVITGSPDGAWFDYSRESEYSIRSLPDGAVLVTSWDIGGAERFVYSARRECDGLRAIPGPEGMSSIFVREIQSGVLRFTDRTATEDALRFARAPGAPDYWVLFTTHFEGSRE